MYSVVDASETTTAANVGYCLIRDDYGRSVWEKSDEKRLIRTQKGPDSDVGDADRINSRIQAAVQEQTKCGVPADLYARRWVPVDNDAVLEKQRSRTDDSPLSFRVFQFNTLAQGLSSGPGIQPPFLQNQKKKGSYGGFTSVPHPNICLDFEKYRKWRLLQVMLEHDPDILGLQEVDRYHGFFEPAMAQFGYSGLFLPKPKSPCVLDFGWYSDGCALFYSSKKFDLVSSKHFCYKAGGNQVCLMATLKALETKQEIVVVVTHLKAKNTPENDFIRKAQTEELLANVAHEESLPVLVLGDFNSEPDRLQGLFTNLRSAYDLSSPSTITTWKKRGLEEVKRVIDYILYNDDKLVCNQVLEIPPDLEALPNMRYPSDHVGLGANFLL